MKNGIKLSICFVICLHISLASNAQTVGLRAGMSLTNMSMKYEDESMSDDFKFKPGFLLGTTVEFPVSPAFAIETGLLFSSKGFKMEESDTYMNETMEYKSKLNLLYLDVPITLLGRLNVGDKTNLFLSAGPYLGFGLGGKAKTEITSNGQTEKDEQDIKFGSDESEDDLKRFDYGLVFGGGIEYGVFQFGVYYEHGLANLSIASDENLKIKNKALNVAVTYRITR